MLSKLEKTLLAFAIAGLVLAAGTVIYLSIVFPGHSPKFNLYVIWKIR